MQASFKINHNTKRQFLFKNFQNNSNGWQPQLPTSLNTNYFQTGKSNLNCLLTGKSKTTDLLTIALKACSSLSGFKKSLFNRVKIANYRLEPMYNRRKHSISHYVLLKNQYSKLSKSLGYIKKKKMDYLIGITLKKTFSTYTQTLTYSKINEKHTVLKFKRSIPYFVALLETDFSPIVYKNLFSYTYAHAKHIQRHHLTKKNACVIKKPCSTNSRFKNTPALSFHLNLLQTNTIINKKWLRFGELVQHIPITKNFKP